LRLPDIPETTADTLRTAGLYVSDLLTPTLRLGVTGLARAGKTVFITALVRNLISGGRLPFFAPHAEGRILRAYLEPQPDDAVPRFDYEGHVRALSGDPPEWPESTRRISELRVTVEYQPSRALRRMLGPARLHIDIVDYPGEWLVDLARIDLDYPAWSAEALTLARDRPDAARDFLDHVAALSADEDPEQAAIRGAAIFTRYLEAGRAADNGLATAGPGRFLTPGDLDGSPMLTFFPLPAAAAADRPALARLMARRYESYRTKVVRPFFADHFARLDRQIVLVDTLGAVNRGAAAVKDLERALEGVLRAFRPGMRHWLYRLMGRRVDRLVIAATKVDHLPASSHDRLEAILTQLTERAAARATGAGAEVHVIALAALRSTREAEVREKGETLPLVVGVPMPGETLGGRTFDGRSEAAIFPGDLPEDTQRVFDAAWAPETDTAVRFLRFRPSRLGAVDSGGEVPPAPHIRLDRALDFLIGDWLA